MTSADDGPDQVPPAPAPRTGSWPVDGPAEVELHLGAGTARVELVPDATTLTVSVAVSRGGRRRGLADVFAALAATPGSGSADDPMSAHAIAETTVDGSGERRRLVVRSPRFGPARGVPLEVTVTAPTGSRVLVRTGSASVQVNGTAAGIDVGTGSGSVTVQDVTGVAQVRTGSGDTRTGHLGSGGQVRTGSGDVAVDGVSGDLDVLTGSGSLRLGIASGVLTELDVRSGSGRARSDLPVVAAAPDAARTMSGTARVRARTGSGDVVVHRANVPA